MGRRQHHFVEFELRQLHCAVNGVLGEECPSQQMWPGGRAAAASPGLGSAEAAPFLCQ